LKWSEPAEAKNFVPNCFKACYEDFCSKLPIAENCIANQLNKQWNNLLFYYVRKTTYKKQRRGLTEITKSDDIARQDLKRKPAKPETHLPLLLGKVTALPLKG
jgi:hypothetical protein